MSGLKLQPRLAYSQPEAICRTLAYRWGAMLLLTDVNETHIMSVIAYLTVRKGGQRTVSLATIRAEHDHPTQTKAYGRDAGFSDANVIEYRGRSLQYVGNSVITKEDVDAHDSSGRISQAIQSQIHQSGKQAAYVLSVHYTYPTGRKSGHSLGIYHSRGGIARRGISARFFEPNLGTWRFIDEGAMLDFVSNDWLPSFLAGTLKHDPGHPGATPRELTYFRLIELEKVR